MPKIRDILQSIPEFQPEERDRAGAFWWCNDSFYLKIHPERPVLLLIRRGEECIQLADGTSHGRSRMIKIPPIPNAGINKQAWVNYRRRWNHSFSKFSKPHHRFRYIYSLGPDLLDNILAKYREYHKIDD